VVFLSYYSVERELTACAYREPGDPAFNTANSTSMSRSEIRFDNSRRSDSQSTPNGTGVHTTFTMNNILSNYTRQRCASAFSLKTSAVMRGKVIAVTALLAAGVLGGCNNNSEKHAAASNGVDASAPVHYASSDYFQQQPGKNGGTLRLSVAADVASLDGHANADTNWEWLGRLIYDNLVYLDDKGEITPWLAKSWTISPDGKTYTFHLRDDVTFSDGTRFNAQAVLVNLEHMRNPATKSPLAAAYIVPYLNGKVIDEYTFQATLKEPYTPFLNVLAQSWLSMESPKAIREHPKQIGESPVGSGPFVVESYTRQQGIRLVKRRDYHWSPDFIRHAGPAYLDRIDIDIVPEAMVRYSSLVSGQYDLTIDAPPQDAGTIRSDKDLHFDARIRQGNPYRGLTFNTSRAPFDDVRVRKAVALSVDRTGVARIMGFGEFAPKADFLAANTRYYDPAYRSVLARDTARANSLLDEAGWTGRDAQGYRTKNGQRLSATVLMYVSPTLSSAGIVEIQSDARKIGFDLKLVALPIAQLLEARNRNDYQAVSGGVWHTNTPDGLYIIYDSHEITSPVRTGQNLSRLDDPELDTLLETARKTTDPEKLKSLYSDAQRRLTELVPVIPLFDNYSLIAYNKRVQGLIYDTSHNTVFLTSAWKK
jgi:peptide/nickel transport system substrate-binding protein